MSAGRLVLLLAAVTACSVESEPEPEGVVPSAQEPARTLLTLDDLPPMPDYPRSLSGRLVVVSDGDFVIDRVWDAEAGSCVTAHDMELYAEDDSSGTVIVFYYPDGNPEGSYSITQVDSVEVGERTAMVGVQIFRSREAFGFQAISGTLELQIADDEVTGRFAATLREVQTEVLTRYVGVFQNIKLIELPDDYCSVLREQRRPDYPSGPVVADTSNRLD